jgi:hypothetical protein
MAGHEEVKPDGGELAVAGGKRGMSRRAMLRGAAGVGAAGLAGTALLGGPAAIAAAATKRPASQRRDPDAAAESGSSAESVVVHVRDLRTGEIDVFRGTSHTRIQDRDLASRLARASH